MVPTEVTEELAREPAVVAAVACTADEEAHALAPPTSEGVQQAGDCPGKEL